MDEHIEESILDRDPFDLDDHRSVYRWAGEDLGSALQMLRMYGEDLPEITTNIQVVQMALLQGQNALGNSVALGSFFKIIKYCQLAKVRYLRAEEQNASKP